MSSPYGMQHLKNQYCSNCKRKKLEDRVSMSCITAVGRLKGVCVVTNAAYARANECFVLRGRHHADPAGVATWQLLRWLLDQYRRRDDWLMVHRSPLCASRRIPLARRALLRL